MDEINVVLLSQEKYPILDSVFLKLDSEKKT